MLNPYRIFFSKQGKRITGENYPQKKRKRQSCIQKAEKFNHPGFMQQPIKNHGGFLIDPESFNFKQRKTF